MEERRGEGRGKKGLEPPSARGAKAERDPELAVRMPDHELWLAFVRDPDDNLVGLMEERRPR